MNSLAQALQNLPQLLQLYGLKLLVAVVLVVLLVVLLIYRSRTVQQEAVMLAQQLASARAAAGEVARPDPRLPMDRIAAHRQELVADAEASISDVLRSADSPAMRAEALVTRGDLYWNLATAPAYPATQPTAVPAQTPEDQLAMAKSAYQQVLSEYPDQQRSRIAALFGLAAIAEQQRDFDTAAEHYRTLIDAADLPMYRDLAQRRLDMLALLREPLYIAPAATLPAGEPAFDASMPELVPPFAPPGEVPFAPPTEVPFAPPPEAPPTEAPPAEPTESPADTDAPPAPPEPAPQ